MSTPRNIVVFMGTRPEAIKLVPMIMALKESPVFVPLVVSTGQHHEMVNEVFELAGIEVLRRGQHCTATGERLLAIKASACRRQAATPITSRASLS